MIWWQWCALGALLLGAEIAIDAEFYLVFLGISAIVVGLIGTTPFVLPMWGQWVTFSIISIGALLLFRSRIYNKIRGQAPDLKEGVAGEIAVVNEPIAPGATGSATLRGAAWQARNVGSEPLVSGSRAIVEETHGLVLSLRLEQ
jgi:membrane protein implicated in regulation of membrane protease activity